MLSLVDNWIVFHFVSAYFAFTTVCTSFSALFIPLAFAVVHSAIAIRRCLFLVYFHVCCLVFLLYHFVHYFYFCILFKALRALLAIYFKSTEITAPFSATLFHSIFIVVVRQVMRKRVEANHLN